MSFLSEDFLLWNKGDKAIIVGVLTPSAPKAAPYSIRYDTVGTATKQFLQIWDVEENLNELERLISTLEGKVLDRIIQKRPQIDAGTFIGKGKALEIKKRVEELGVSNVVFDENLSPSQVKNLEDIIGCRVLDRTGVILEIFHKNARTAESKTQVNIARLKYILPRLTGMWTHLERQRGAGGGSAGMMGMGEKQIESDRRLIKSRISQFEKKLDQIKKDREQQRKHREDILKVALVGYTNAGKSSLMNLLTQSDVLAEDRLFATLDSSIRTLNPDTQPKILLIDTVGFIKKLPPDLVASFKSTLEEIKEADMILHVVDVSHPKFKEHIQITEKVLHELECENKPGFLVLNKSDLMEEPLLARISARSYKGIYENTVVTSINDLNTIRELRESILEFFYKNLSVWEVLVPYEDPEIAAKIHEFCHVEAKRYLEKGVFFKLKTTPHHAGRLNLNKYKLGEGFQLDDFGGETGEE